MMKVLSFQEVSKNKWMSFVDSHPHRTVFHTSFAISLFEGLEGYNPFGLALVDENDQIQALMTGVVQTVKQGILAPISRRIVLYASPLFANDINIEYLNLLMNNLNRFRAVYTEIRNSYDQEQERPFYRSSGYKFEDHLNILIDLTKDKEQLWKKVHSKRRNEIRKAKKEGLTFRMFDGDEVPDAYAILREVYDRVKLPLFPKSFFAKGFNISTSEVAMRGFGVYFDGKMVGCMIVLCYGDIIYDFYAGSLSEYYPKNPNDLIPWEVFLWGKDHGYRIFDFGGAGKPDQPYGVRDYKLKFGGNLVDLGRYTRVRNKIVYKIAELGFSTLQKINKI